MKAATFSILFATVTQAHYAIKSLTIDGNQVDDWVGAKRIEWGYTDNDNFTWMALTSETKPNFACGSEPTPPALRAFARAGSDVIVQWTKVPRHHYGPSMNYLGLYKSDPTQVSFFSVKSEGYDAAKGLWANQIIINNNNQERFKIPSDIKPGLYILRSELLSLHGIGQEFNPGLKGLPQFYTHCFNIQITGSGNASPAGVKFPGGYRAKDPSVYYKLAPKSPARYATYTPPGPKPYKGKYDPPTGAKPSVTAEQVGTFPAAFEAKYKAFLGRMNAWSDRAVDFFDDQKGGLSFVSKHKTEGDVFKNERKSLRREAIKLGLVDPNTKEPRDNQIFKRTNSFIIPH